MDSIYQSLHLWTELSCGMIIRNVFRSALYFAVTYSKYLNFCAIMDHYCMYIGFYRDTRGQRKGHK